LTDMTDKELKDAGLTTVMVPVTMPAVLKETMSVFDPDFKKLGYFFSACLKKEVDDWKENKDKYGDKSGMFNLTNFFTGGGQGGTA